MSRTINGKTTGRAARIEHSDRLADAILGDGPEFTGGHANLWCSYHQKHYSERTGCIPCQDMGDAEERINRADTMAWIKQ
jgi:hypothetical protein